MSSQGLVKCACDVCGSNIEFPFEGAGLQVACPHCNEQTTLCLPARQEPAAVDSDTTSPLTLEDLNGAFSGTIPKTPVSFLYQAGLVIVALTMVILPVIYLVLIGVAGYGVYLWATRFTFLLGGPGGFYLTLIKLFLYGTPLISGLVVVFFMIKPLLARSPPQAQPLALNPASEPVLYAYIGRICAVVGAPQPRRIDIDCNLNASAGLRRGFLSMFGSDLVLTIGLPLVAGLNTRELAGVLAHEFGHFSQGFGMRLSYIIRRVNSWFARVIYERDVWDLFLEELSESTDAWQLMLLFCIVRLAVWISRTILKILMIIGHIIGCFLIRQMEYDADSYNIKLAGSKSFEDTKRRLHVLDRVSDLAYREMRVGWNNSETLPDNFPRWMMFFDTRLEPERRVKIEDTMGFGATGIFDTHPSNGDRIRRARQAGTPGVFHLETPATRLFSNFDAVAKQVTHIHYSDDLGIPAQFVRLVPVPDPNQRSVPEPEPQVTVPPAVAALRPKLKLRSRGESRSEGQ